MRKRTELFQQLLVEAKAVKTAPHERLAQTAS
jgi:hypothetical protein